MRNKYVYTNVDSVVLEYNCAHTMKSILLDSDKHNWTLFKSRYQKLNGIDLSDVNSSVCIFVRDWYNEEKSRFVYLSRNNYSCVPANPLIVIARQLVSNIKR